MCVCVCVCVRARVGACVHACVRACVRACDEAVVYRKYDKKSYCYFCQKSQLKLARHLRTVHKCEEEVEKYINTNDSASKNQQLMKLRNMGNHEHNLRIIQKRTG